jgi:diaminopimelate decarboxylase
VPEVRRSCDGRGAVGESVLTRAFARVDGALACEGVPLSTIAQAVGTPTYVYSANAVREQYTRLAAALHGVPFRIHYSLKANSNLALLRLLHSLGSAADVVSAGELYRATRAGFAPADIIFGGVGENRARDRGRPRRRRAPPQRRVGG